MQHEQHHSITVADISIGDTIVYVLRSDQRPTNLDRKYTGMVTKILPSGNEVLVTLTDAQYQGLSEPVEVAQIIRLEKRTGTQPEEQQEQEQPA
jgi:uncharacterized protein YfaS (alpha-2-macroglobulin family)